MSTSTSNSPSPAGAKRKRGRTGCLNCRARRKKCDEVKPTCSRCVACNDTCRWDDAFPFRSVGIAPDHPSMTQSQRHMRRPGQPEQPELRIIDVNFENSSKRRRIQSSLRHQDRSQTNNHTSDSHNGAASRQAGQDSALLGTKHHERSQPSLTTSSVIHDASHGHINQNDRTASPALTRNAMSLQTPNTTRRTSIDSATQRTDLSDRLPIDTPQFDDTDLGTLDFLTSHTSNIDMIASAVQTGDLATWSPENSDLSRLPSSNGESFNMSSPDSYSIYYPNAAYRELHSTLHQHMVETARNTALSKQSDMAAVSHDNYEQGSRSENRRLEAGRRRTSISSTEPRHLRCDLVTPRRQLQLWRNYLDEIAPWLDMFDSERHFQTAIPHMSKTAECLHYSVLALSARQLERRSSERLYTESLALYQRAINTIAHRLQHLETEVIASCVLLCVLEMMSSSPRAWSRHLDGCAMLLEAADINGVVGGVRQAIFWCFARMDLWGGYLGDTVTKIPTNRWFVPSGSMASAVSQFKAGSGVDTYANYAVFLCASAVNVISAQEMSQARRHVDSAEIQALFNARWKALYDLLENWYDDRPEELIPLMIEHSAGNDYQNPFPIVLYATTPGTSGNQMYHAAALLMLQHKPKSVRLAKSRKSILWHARQICGIATSNADHNAWTNALQPLWMAGKVMSHPSEHRAILEILHRIDKETGFATEWRANDLKEYWGDTSE